MSDAQPISDDGAVTGSADAAAVLNAVRILFRAIRLNNVDVERQLGISLAQLYVVEQLARNHGCSVNDLADLTRTHQSSVSVVVRKLVERGFVEKRTSPVDGRRAELSLTPSGRALLERSPTTFQSTLMQGLEQLGAARTGELARGLTELLTACGLDDPSPPLLFEEESRAATGSGGTDGA